MLFTHISHNWTHAWKLGAAQCVLRPACVAAMLFLLPFSPAQAAVVSSGHVTPVDFIFTTQNEGLPPNGNFLDLNRVILDPITGEITGFLNQITWEGIPGLTANDNEHILVGASNTAGIQPGSGTLQINSGSELRFMDLIIGGNTADDLNAMPSAHGTVEITGPGSLFNSDYELIPPELYLPGTTILPFPGNQVSVNPRGQGVDDMDIRNEDGFDLRMGVSAQSSGSLNISAGGVAEIHDSIIIGEAAGSFATATVDGSGSILQGGGKFAPPGFGENDPHMMIVGQLGDGTLNVLNGGRVIAKAFEQSDNESTYSAAIGDSPLVLPASRKGVEDSPQGGGSGTVNVEGTGSLFTIGGGLLVGGFSQPEDTPIASDFDVEGNDVRYGSNVGDGTLNLRDGGQVAITTPASIGTTSPFSNLSIGHFGRINLESGIVSVGNANNRNENAVLTNDGIISGHGTIETGIFRNRLLGEVSVNQDELLTVISGSGFDISDLGDDPDLEELPMTNYGLIHVDRGEIEFLRAEDGSNPGGGLDPGDTFRVQAFHNSAIQEGSLNPNFTQRVGEIKSYNGTLNFKTGLENQGRVIFYGGNDNILLGDVLNQREITIAEDADGAVPEGEVLISGDETFATFNGNFTNNGYMEVGPAATGFQVVGDFTMGVTGTLATRINSAASVLGAADMAGVFRVELPLPGEVEFDPMHGDVFNIFYASQGITTLFDGSPGTLFFDLPFLGLTSGFIPLVDLIGGSIDLLAFDVAFTTGGDLNGDGIVDDDDLMIYEANRGNPGGLGDINGDGIVNGLDLAIIFMQFGGPGMITATGGATGGAVPEPASCAMVLVALLALSGRRRRL